MSLFVFTSAKGSPGVTTLACGLGAAWPGSAGRQVAVVECDPFGGDLAAWFRLSAERGLVSLAVAAHQGREHQRNDKCSFRDATGSDQHWQQLAGGLDVLVGPVRPIFAPHLIAIWPVVVDMLSTAAKTADILVDIGRFVPDRSSGIQQELADAADIVAVVCRPDASGIAHAMALLPKLSSPVLPANNMQGTSLLAPESRTRILLPEKDPPGARLVSLMVGGSRFQNDEAANLLGVPCVGAVAHDPEAAEVIRSGTGNARRFERSAFLRTCTSAAEALLDAANRASGPVSLTAPERSAVPHDQPAAQTRSSLDDELVVIP